MLTVVFFSNTIDFIRTFQKVVPFGRRPYLYIIHVMQNYTIPLAHIKGCVPLSKNIWTPVNSHHVARMGEGRGVHRVLWGNLREGDHWEDPDVDGRIILRRIFRKWERAQDRDRWRALVGTVTNFRVPQMRGIS
jgi:hypothetical protein